jgi:tetratricopeptide (TPR) repeat protein
MSGEYRILTQKQAKDRKYGALAEVSRNIGEYFQVGIGYNFTEFNDDLTRLSYTSHGPFFRITGKLYDRSPEEKKRARKERLKQKKERMFKQQIKSFVEENKGNPEGRELLKLYKEANNLFAEGKFAEAEEKYNQVLMNISRIEAGQRSMIDKRLKKEAEINLLSEGADELYKRGELNKALEEYRKCLKEIENLKG